MLRIEPVTRVSCIVRGILGGVFFASLVGCEGMQTQTVAKLEYIKAPVVIPVEPFDMCAPTDGDQSPAKWFGHAMDSKPYGCM